jgi:filamentous hemagglutinin family protein
MPLPHRLGPPLLAALLTAAPVQAQIVTDGSVGPKVSLRGGEIEIGAKLGTQRGDNLFHSFEKFGIAPGQTATFTGPGDIKNVISRVTGGEVSNIDGTLASRVGQADLYFLNPAGVLFGPNAKLDVPGSFHVSTAHELRFGDGTRFSALDKTGSGLTVAPPEAFGFLDKPAGQITANQSQFEIQMGKTLSLAGGNLDLTGGTIAAAGEASMGVVFNAVSVASPGEVRVSDGAVSAAQLGSIRMTDQRITASGSGGGTVRIRAGTLIADNSTIDTSNTTERAAVGGIDLRVDTARLINSRIVSDALGTGPAGSITIAAGTLEVRDGGAITSNTHASGAAGIVSIRADSMIVSGGSLLTKTVISSDVIKEDASGAAKGVTITAGTLEVRDGGVVSSDTLGRGRAGTVTIEADHLVVTSGRPPNFPTRISSRPQPLSTGTGGAIKITAGAVEVSDGAAISTSTLGAGNAGDVIVNADSVMISGGGGAGIFSGNFRDSRGSPSQAGMVQITARKLELRDGGQISTDTRTAGSAGTVTIRADHLVVASGRPNGLITLISSRTYSTGNGGTVDIGGKVDITAGVVEVRGEGMMTNKNAHISTSTFSSGHAGKVIIHADAVVVSGRGGEIASRAHRTGNGGAVDIFARSIRLSNGGVVNTESIDPGAGAGVSGPITIVATDTLLLDQGSIQTLTKSADGGDVSLSVGRLFDLHDSKVTTSVAGGKGRGGNILINSPLMVLDNSEITANAIGGGGGDIFIDAGQLIRTPDSAIMASGSVNGNITITAPNTDVAGSLVVLPETFLDVSSQLRETCTARGGRRTSSLTPGGRGGLPPDPGAPLAASPVGQPLEQPTTKELPTSSSRPPQAAKPITVSGIPQPVLGSPRLTCRG